MTMHNILIMHCIICNTTYILVCSGWIVLPNGVQTLPCAAPPWCYRSAMCFEILIVLPQWIGSIGSLFQFRVAFKITVELVKGGVV